LREVPREGQREDPRRDEFPPVSDDDSSQSLIMRTTTYGALDLRVRDCSNLTPELVEQAVAVARSITTVHALEAKSRALEAKSRAIEAKSRAIHDIVVPVIAIAAFAFVALRLRP
jgi:hypothetical protein